MTLPGSNSPTKTQGTGANPAVNENVNMMRHTSAIQAATVESSVS